MTIKDKIVLVTGASAGIGAACAEIFSENHCRVILLARRKDKTKKLADELMNKYNSEILTLECDVRKNKDVEAALNSIPEDWKSIDILINNAGLARGIEKIQDGVIEKWDEMIDTNIKGLLYVSRVIIPWMITRQTGMIINIGSFAGREVYPAGNVYCSTKHAVKAISKGMTIDLNGTGIRVVNLDPGLVETEFSLVRFSGDTDKASAIYKGYTPLYGRDIAEVALFCATRPAHVTIQDILVAPTDQASTMIVNKK